MRAARWIRIGLEMAAAVLLVLLLAHRFLPGRAASPSLQNQVAFTLTGLDGNPIPPAAYQGKAILLNFWAPWCPPCRLEIPWLQKLQDQNRGKLVVVGVVADPSEYAHAAAMMRQKGITYLLVRDSADVRAAFGEISVLPTSFYVTPTGRVVHTTRGLVPEPLMLLFAHQAIHG